MELEQIVPCEIILPQVHLHVSLIGAQLLRGWLSLWCLVVSLADDQHDIGLVHEGVALVSVQITVHLVADQLGLALVLLYQLQGLLGNVRVDLLYDFQFVRVGQLLYLVFIVHWLQTLRVQFHGAVIPEP